MVNSFNYHVFRILILNLIATHLRILSIKLIASAVGFFFIRARIFSSIFGHFSIVQPEQSDVVVLQSLREVALHMLDGDNKIALWGEGAHSAVGDAIFLEDIGHEVYLIIQCLRKQSSLFLGWFSIKESSYYIFYVILLASSSTYFFELFLPPFLLLFLFSYFFLISFDILALSKPHLLKKGLGAFAVLFLLVFPSYYKSASSSAQMLVKNSQISFSQPTRLVSCIHSCILALSSQTARQNIQCSG